MSTSIDLDTPCLTLDLDILESNLRRMQTLATGAGKRLRPHAKTHKCSSLAKRQLEMGATGVCVAKVSEAERLVDAGIHGILITGPVSAPNKIRRLVDVLTRSSSLMVVVDHVDTASLLSTALQERNLAMDVLLDLDVGLHRTGVLPSAARRLSRHVLSLRNLRLRGIQAYAGHLQHISSYTERVMSSHAALLDAVRVFKELRVEVETCRVFSASGTGTHDIDLAIPEITELQVGSYACMDTEYLAIGSAEDQRQFTAFGPALRVQTTVVSANQPGFVTVDAGLKSVYRDGGMPRVFGPQSEGLHYDWFGDEYGRITAEPGATLPPLGAVLELIPSHCDPTINLFDRVHLTRGSLIVDSWSIDLRGCSQ